MFTFVHAADVHLDSPLVGLERHEGAPIDAIRGATRRALENLVEVAIEARAAFVILAGDLYDGDWRDYNTGLFFSRQMARLKEADIAVFVVSGNHDAASQITKSLHAPDNVRRFATGAAETHVLHDLGVAIHGRSYASRIVDQDLSTSYPEAKSDLFNIGVLHSSLDGRPGHASYAPCSLGSLRAKHYQYWALGHVHAREIVSQDPWVVFPGNPQGRHAREIGPKGCVLVTVDENEVTGAEMRALDVVRWTHCRVDLSCAVSVAQGLDLSGQALAKEVMDSEGRLLAARVELVGATATHRELAGARERLIAELRSLAADRWGDEVWIEKVVIATRPEAARRSDDPTVETVARWIRPLDALREDTELVDGLVRELAELQGRLPVELTGAGVFEPLEIASPEAVKRLLGEARELLLSRLLPERG